MTFETEVTLTGPVRRPVQMLAEQEVGGQLGIHDQEAADTLGLGGAPIEAPTHFSQFDPLAVSLWGEAWFERGCISSHFRTMVVEGEEVVATMSTRPGSTSATIAATKADGTPVLAGSASIGPDHGTTALEARLATMGDPGDLFIVDQLELGTKLDDGIASVDFDTRNGPAYPFSLAEKLATITEPHPWYTAESGATSPWGAPVLPMEMVSVLANKQGRGWRVRGPVLGLFLDLEVRIEDGPVLVGRDYRIERELVGLGQSRRTESMWVRTTLTDAETGVHTATFLLHSGYFKESYADYPKDRLT